MVKIHKSSVVTLDSAKPVIIKRPELGRGLRDTMLAGAESSQYHMLSKVSGGIDPVPEVTNQSKSQIIQDALQEAECLVAQAEARAAAILSKAQQESERIRRTAREEAYAAGKMEASSELERHIGQCDQALSTLLKNIRSENDRLVERLEPQLLELSVAVAKKIVGHDLEHCADTFRKMVRCLIERIRPEDRLTIYVNDQDYQYVFMDETQRQSGEANLIKIIPDTALPRGSCKLEGAFGQLDASVETQIDGLKDLWGITI